MPEEVKRLFFGWEVHSPWPSKLPQGRLLDEAHRHLTVAFLGNIPYLPLQEILHTFPKPCMRVGSVGNFDACLTLPPRHPHVIAWHMQGWEDPHPLHDFQKKVMHWLSSHQYAIETREWNPHVTLCRSPFDAQAWKEAFMPLPFYTSSLHLYESTGNLHYMPLWSYSLYAPFEEIDHTADMAFIIRGESLQHLYQNAFTALAFKVPSFLDFFIPQPILNDLDDVIITLNAILAHVDCMKGCPLKAISFHGEIARLEHSLLQWEMIVDV